MFRIVSFGGLARQLGQRLPEALASRLPRDTPWLGYLRPTHLPGPPPRTARREAASSCRPLLTRLLEGIDLPNVRRAPLAVPLPKSPDRA